MKLFRYAAFGISLGLLVGCSGTAEPTSSYDIDVRCWRDRFFIGMNRSNYESVEEMYCLSPDYFTIQCDVATVQVVNEYTTCTTKDKRSIRIREYAPSTSEVQAENEKNDKKRNARD